MNFQKKVTLNYRINPNSSMQPNLNFKFSNWRQNSYLKLLTVKFQISHKFLKKFKFYMNFFKNKAIPLNLIGVKQISYIKTSQKFP